MKVLVGFSDTCAATLKYLIKKEISEGLYLAERFCLMQSFYGSPYLASSKEVKVHLTDTCEEEV